MQITIINDCRDENAKGRQVTRAESLFNAPVSFIGATHDLEASGMIIDTLDSLYGGKGLILANVAPRSRKAWWLSKSIDKFSHFNNLDNGTPFCYTRVDNTDIVSTLGGYMLSLLKKFKLIDKVHVFNYHESLKELVKLLIIDQEEADRISSTQFRSLNFMPRVAHAYISKGILCPGVEVPIEGIPDAPARAWFADNFGNIKTTLTLDDYGGKMPKEIELGGRTIPMYNRLKDVPEGQLGAAVGSSGYKDDRFIEVYIQGGNAAEVIDV
ncbi:MAG: SAM hydroxide adenosyltransferase [Patescibacteria group bacterium]